MKKPLHREILTRNPRVIQDSVTVRHFAIDLGLWISMLALRHYSAGVLASGALAMGFAVFCFRAFGMMHECVHSAGASSRRWNNVVGAFCGVFCFLPFRSWQDVHLNHHMWTGNVEKDPSTRLLLQFKRDGYRTAPRVSFAWKYWIPLLAFLQHIVFWRATKSKSELIYVGLSVAFLGATAVALGPGTMLFGLLVYLYMVEIINFPHHLGVEQFEGESRFGAPDQARFTRTAVYSKWFAHYVLLNFNLHTEHHLFPAHPWYALDAIHEEISRGGLLVNKCEANAWILENRAKPIEEIMAQTYAGQAVVKKPAA